MIVALEHFSKINLSLGAVVIVCFFLPWFNIDCGDVAIVKLSGYDLTTGRFALEQEAIQGHASELARNGGDLESLQSEHQTRPQAYLMIVVISAIGMIVYSARMLQDLNRPGILAVGAFGAAGLLVMVFAAARDFGVDMPADILRMVRTTHPPAFFLTIMSFLSAAVLSAFGLYGRSTVSDSSVSIGIPSSPERKLPQVVEELPSVEKKESFLMTDAFGEPLNQPAERQCPSCGAVITAQQTSCGQCGSPVQSGT